MTAKSRLIYRTTQNFVIIPVYILMGQILNFILGVEYFADYHGEKRTFDQRTKIMDIFSNMV